MENNGRSSIDRVFRSIKETTGKEYLLAIQHLFAMFGATVLVPIITGLNPSVALVTAGIGTLLFHLTTKRIVPVFLGSSFAFIGAIQLAVQDMGIPYAQGAIMVAGGVYLLFALIVYAVGTDRIKKLFPPVVTGPVIIVIGLSLADVGIGDVTANGSIGWLIALFVVAVIIICNAFSKKGIFKVIPILIGIASGYLLCVILHFTNVITMDFSAFADNKWLNIPYHTENFFTLPKFNMSIILSIAPISLVTFMEHIGDITTNGAVVGKDFYKNPGLHRTLLGDGVATITAGFIGGPPNTTYSENTGVLAATKNYNPKILRIAAIFAILLGFFGKFGAILETIPKPVIGGIELVLFGMIATIGIRTLSESKADLTQFRNVIVVSLILVLGIGISVIGGIAVKFGSVTIVLSGLFIATVIGVITNLILPKQEEIIEQEESAKQEEPNE